MNRFYLGDWMDSGIKFVDELPDEYIKKNNNLTMVKTNLNLIKMLNTRQK